MSRFQKSHVDELFLTGKTEQALGYLLRHEQSGSIDACIALADYYLDKGEKAKSDQHIQLAETLLKSGDVDGHLSLISAYNTALGAGGREKQQRQALRHMEVVAEHGNVHVQVELMHHFLYGLNGAPKDQSKFEYWAKRAMDGGSKTAHEVWKTQQAAMKK